MVAIEAGVEWELLAGDGVRFHRHVDSVVDHQLKQRPVCT